MKRFLCSLLIIIVLVSLVGCSSKKSVDVENTTTSTQDKTQVNTQVNTTEEPASVNGADTEPESQKESNGQVIIPDTPDVKNTEPDMEIVESTEKKWALLVKGKDATVSMPVYDGKGEPAVPIVSIAKALGLDVEWVSDTEVSLWYGDTELFINPEVENLGIYHPLGAGEPIREKIGQDYYIDIPSASFVVGQWGGSHVSIDSGSMIIMIQ